MGKHDFSILQKLNKLNQNDKLSDWIKNVKKKKFFMFLC